MKDKAYFCPECGGSAITRSALAGGDASCATCNWKGTNEELRAVEFEHDFNSTEQVMQVFTAEFTTIVGKHLAEPLGRFLLKWGFIQPANLASDLPLFLRAMAQGAATGMMELRQGLETGAVKRPAKRRSN